MMNKKLYLKEIHDPIPTKVSDAFSPSKNLVKMGYPKTMRNFKMSTPKHILITLIILIIFIAACEGQPGTYTNPADGMKVATISSSTIGGVTGPTLVPTSQPGDHGPFILMVDDFSDLSSGWEISENEYGRTVYQDGSYLVQSYVEKEYYWGVAGLEAQDIRLDVDIRVDQTTESGDDAYGPDCRVQSNGDGYGFRISSDGYAGIQKYVDGEGTNLAEWTKSDVIQTNGSTNTITAVCQGNHLQLLVNGESLLEVVDETYTSGDVALSVIGYEPGTVTVLFDNITIQQIGNPYDYEDVNAGKLTIVNSSGMDACYVYVTSPANPTWGSNLINEEEGDLRSGEVRTFQGVTAGEVDILVMSCDYLRLAELYGYEPGVNPQLEVTAPVLLKEFSFIEPDGWTTLTTDYGSTLITNADYYSISANGEPGLMLGMVRDDYTDIIIHTELMLVKPGTDNQGYSGPVCRADLNGYGILFAVRGDGQAAILKLKGGKTEVLQGWSAAENILTGIQYNFIEARCEGSTYSMFVNGEFIGSVVDDSYTNGGIGVVAVSPPGSVTQADYDFLRLYQP